MDKIVAMACTHHFDSAVQVGSHHIARCFAKRGWRVLYLSAPVSLLHLVRPGANDRYVRLGKAFIQSRSVTDRIEEIIPFAPVVPTRTPLLDSPFLARLWPRITIPPLARLLKKLVPGGVDVLYLDNIFYLGVLDLLPHRRSVFRIADRHDAFPGWKRTAGRIAGNLARHVDCVVYSAQGLADYAASLKPRRSAFLPNGVDWLRFSKPCVAHPLIRDLKPCALYVGTLDRRIDVPMIRCMAERIPECTFVLAGPVMEGVHVSGLPSNVRLLGVVKYEFVAALLSGADVVFIPFDVTGQSRRIEGVRPLKLLEALAAGKPVVCARWAEVESMGGPALLYDGVEDCERKLRLALEGMVNGDLGRRFTRDHDWGRRFEELMSLIESTRVEG